MDEAPVGPGPVLRFLQRLLLLLFLLGVFGSFYYTLRQAYLHRIFEEVAQGAMDGLWTVRVEKIGGVRIDWTGDVILTDAEVSTEYRGESRKFLRTKRLILSFSGVPLRDPGARLMRVDLLEPEIFALRYPDGDWNLYHAFQPHSREPGAESGGFPPNGIHITRGTVHVAFRDRERKEVSWRIDRVAGEIRKEGETFFYHPFRGDFYGGVVEARATVPPRETFSIDFQSRIREADLGRMSEGVPFLKKPLQGRLDLILSMTSDESRIGVDPVVAGYAKVSEGDLWELPAFLSVLNALSIQSLNDRKIEGGEARFTMKENQIRVDQLDLQGTPVSLYGSGTVDLTGQNLELVFVPTVSSGFRRLIPVIGEPVQGLLDLIMGAIVPVKVVGSWAEAKGTVAPDEKLSEPVQKLWKERKPE